MEGSSRQRKHLQHAQYLLHLGTGVHHSRPVGKGRPIHSWCQSATTSTAGNLRLHASYVNAELMLA